MHNNELDFQNIIYIFMKGWKIILSSVFICFLVAYIYTNLTLNEHEYYITSASMVINSKTYTINEGELEVSGVNNIFLSQKMVNTYRVILISNNVLERVIYDLGINAPTSIIRSWVTVTSPIDTEVIMVSVINKDPQLAADIANSIMRVAPQVISKTVEVGSINVLDEAKVPNIPLIKSNNYILNLTVGCVLGFMMGGFITLLISLISPKLKNKKEMLELLSLNCLGEIPHITDKYKKNNPNLLITNENIDHSFKEGYKNLTELVIYESKKYKFKTLIVTSAVPEEGKTYVSVNLALSMALSGKKTLLIDFDCYKEGIMELFELKPDKFLIDILKEDIHYSRGVLRDQKTGLDIIFSEECKFIDLNMMNSQKMKETFEDVESDYDYIIIDTPSALFQSEAVALSRYSDGVILVMKQETATISDIIETRDRIQNIGSKIIGGVLNDIRYLAGTEYGKRYNYSLNNYNYKKESLCKKTIIDDLDGRV